MTNTWKNPWPTDDPWHWGFDDRTKVQKGFACACEVQLPYGRLDNALSWCREEVVKDWRWQMRDHATPTNPGRYIFYFDSEQDKCAFLMKWS